MIPGTGQEYKDFFDHVIKHYQNLLDKISKLDLTKRYVWDDENDDFIELSQEDMEKVKELSFKCCGKEKVPSMLDDNFDEWLNSLGNG